MGGLNKWLTDEKTKLKKKMHDERKANGLNRRKVKHAEVVLPDRIEQKLKMGLSLLMALAEALHTDVLKINPEPGCQINAGWKAEDSSLLVSSPCKLAPYPGLGKGSVRFPPALQLKAPPKDAAPAACANQDPALPPPALANTGRPLVPTEFAPSLYSSESHYVSLSLSLSLSLGALSQCPRSLAPFSIQVSIPFVQVIDIFAATLPRARQGGRDCRRQGWRLSEA